MRADDSVRERERQDCAAAGVDHEPWPVALEILERDPIAIVAVRARAR
jgi:hypothetical protein